LNILGPGEVAAAAPYRDLVEALRRAFREPATVPVRHHHATVPGTTLLLMPAWTTQWTGLKQLTVKPDNVEKGLPSIQGSYLLLDNETGAPVAVMDAGELTRRRTAAASALAVDYLARPDASLHAIIGAGALCPHFARAHRSVRPIAKTLIANRSHDKAESAAKLLRDEGVDAEACDMEQAVRQADIVSVMTNSTAPLILGKWLKQGTHLDLVGAYTPAMRETDADAVAYARVFVDDRKGALAEAGDLLQARDEGRFDFADVQADLAELCAGQHRGRQNGRDITLFKSCGMALEDLAAAVMIHHRTAR
jgi:ornithine cyclodeaminase/alanine dehydrogenase-like protein (mu-crystallin family)